VFARSAMMAVANAESKSKAELQVAQRESSKDKQAVLTYPTNRYISPDGRIIVAELKSEDLTEAEKLEEAREERTEKAILSLDNLGIFASVLCLIHCLAMPFIIAAIPFLGMNCQWLQSELTENILITFIIGFAVFAIIPGYWTHKKPLALAGLVVGMSLVGAVALARGHFPPSMELPLISCGNLILVITHLLNRKFTHGSFLAHSHGHGHNKGQTGAGADHGHGAHHHGPNCNHKH
jgi:MerC mercury resistance protein